jgi:hypothetical protein
MDNIVIKTFDNFMDSESHKLIEKEVNAAQLRSYWSSSNRMKSSWHWHCSIFQDTSVLPVATNHDIRDISQKTPYIMNLWKDIQKKISEELDYKCDFARAYINAHTHGIDGMIHSDDGDYTAIYYPLSEWDIEWEGGTCFYNKDKTDVIHYNAYVPNRLVVFDAKINHRAMPVARECYKLRPVVVFKCVIDVSSEQYFRKYYRDNPIK